MKSFNLVIFDFDGTLYDTKPGMRSVLCATLAKFGFDPLVYNLNEFVGPPLEWSLEHIVGANPAQVQAMVADYRPKYHQSMLEHLVFFEGIVPLLHHLYGYGIILAIASLKLNPAIDGLLTAAKLKHLFSCIADYNLEFKPSKADLIAKVKSTYPDKHAIMIGDRSFDLEGAQLTNTPFVGVGFGYARDEHELAGSTYFAPTVAHLATLLDDLCGLNK
jgi:phosphoglycolate phosphatase